MTYEETMEAARAAFAAALARRGVEVAPSDGRPYVLIRLEDYEELLEVRRSDFRRRSREWFRWREDVNDVLKTRTIRVRLPFGPFLIY